MVVILSLLNKPLLSFVVRLIKLIKLEVISEVSLWLLTIGEGLLMHRGSYLELSITYR